MVVMTEEAFKKQMEWVIKNKKKLYYAQATFYDYTRLSNLRIFASNIEEATEYAKKYFEPDQTVLFVEEIK